ncbi:MAG: glucose-1-phosphate thymidylyltransferase RfbA [Rickettsiales bacterium]|jgi:glucose-1-phosphate thymidylyltransferase|nr:glucose-1-phosphate thymidylyltransferase RfbA [Rickettsiales bacterium]
MNKGIILAGGLNTRLHPMTFSISKQMLPVYDKPMIYYPLSTLMMFGIRDILLISTPRDIPMFRDLLHDGSQWGIHIEYAQQPEPEGIAQAFVIGEDFINGEQTAMILGDNIIHTGYLSDTGKKLSATPNHATIFTYKVSDPQRFGIVEFDKQKNVISIEEKPAKPKSNFAAIGLYCYPGDVAQYAKKVKKSARGEYEITDLSNLYLAEGRLKTMDLGYGATWLDAGTEKSLMLASNFIGAIEETRGIKISCPEEIALEKGFINECGMELQIAKFKRGGYADYLRKVLKDHQNAI